MGNFNRDGNRSFGGNSDREMYKATCADCGRECEIPFRPTNGRPVYCRDDFKKHSPDEGRGRDMGRGNDRGGSRNFSRDNSRGGDREMFDAVCANCGNNCKVPFQPREGKDTLCSNCFEEKGGDPRRSNNNAPSPQLNDINAKLDRILELLSPTEKTPKKDKSAKIEVLAEEVMADVVSTEEASSETEENVESKKPKAKKTAKTA